MISFLVSEWLEAGLSLLSDEDLPSIILETFIKLAIEGDYHKLLSDGKMAKDQYKENLILTMLSGIVADKANKLLHIQRNLIEETDEDLDLSGVLKDGFGDFLAAAKIKFLAMINTSTTQTFTVKPASSNGFVGPFGAASHSITVKPRTAINPSFAVIIADPNGYPVTAETGDLLNVANNAGEAADYQLIIVATGG